MPVPVKYKTGISDGTNKAWKIEAGRFTIKLWAGAARGSYPADSRLRFDEYKTFHAGLYEDTYDRIEEYRFIYGINITKYIHNYVISRKQLDDLYDFLCKSQGIMPEGCFVISNGKKKRA